jgi:hypothetical protein
MEGEKRLVQERHFDCDTGLANKMTEPIAKSFLGSSRVVNGLIVKGWSFPAEDALAGRKKTVLTVRFLQ